MLPSERLIAQPRAHRAVPYVIGAVVVAVPVVMLGGSDWQIIGGVVLAWALTMSSSIVLWRRARHQAKSERRAWTWVSAGLMLASIGLMISMAAEATFAGDQLRFGVADVFFLSASMCGMAGVLQLPHGTGIKALRIQTAFDGLIGGIAVGVILWVFLISDIVAAAPGSSFQAIMGRLYPVVDLIVLTTVLTITVRRTAYHFEPRLLTLSAGLTVQAGVDLIYLNSTRPDAIVTSGTDRLVVALTLLAVSAYAITAVLPDRKVEVQIRRATAPLLITVFPYAMVSVLVVILGIEAGTDITIVTKARSLEYSLGVAVLVLLLLVRQAVSIRENRTSLETQRRELVASISHEVRTPVTAILASLELLDTHGGQLPAEERVELDGIALEQTRYMARMIEDLILLSRNATSGLKLRARRIPVDEVIEHATAGFEGIEIERRGTEGLTVTADPDRLSQAVGNYVSNAAQYGGGRCIISVDQTDQLLVIDVHDDGPGVPYRYREVVWEHFERGNHRLDSQVQGSGIGLAVVDLVARAHGGYVEYRRSELLGGACFTIALPVTAQTAGF